MSERTRCPRCGGDLVDIFGEQLSEALVPIMAILGNCPGCCDRDIEEDEREEEDLEIAINDDNDDGPLTPEEERRLEDLF